MNEQQQRQERERIKALIAEVLRQQPDWFAVGPLTDLALSLVTAARQDGKREGVQDAIKIAEVYCSYLGGQCNSSRCVAHQIVNHLSGFLPALPPPEEEG